MAKNRLGPSNARRLRHFWRSVSDRLRRGDHAADESEAALAGLLLTTNYAPLLLILTATAGIVLESVVNPHARFNHADHGCCWSFRLNSL
ncbi:hypothetical protein NKH89_12110 [Mesorhizobium sp. M0923]|uniref:hypothetical protein n=1 Tax=Mesorhizobium sp. M0923 TaxID=2957028 RepID=UPI0033378B0E